MGPSIRVTSRTTSFATPVCGAASLAPGARRARRTDGKPAVQPPTTSIWAGSNRGSRISQPSRPSHSAPWPRPAVRAPSWENSSPQVASTDDLDLGGLEPRVAHQPAEQTVPQRPVAAAGGSGAELGELEPPGCVH